MIILVHNISPRLRYISDFIGKELIGESIELTTDRGYFDQSPGPRIHYTGETPAPGAFHLQPHSLLFESGIREQEIRCSLEKKQKVFFQTGGDYSFDIFAASFYLLSRYEEYLPHKKDFYGRYAHENSLAFREGFLETPLVNFWLMDFAAALKAKFPSLDLKKNSFRFLPSYDIDEAWSYRNKSWFRTWGGSVKALLKGQWSRVKLRRDVLNGKKGDPYDSYDWLISLHEKYKLNPYYFFLVAESTGKYDRNILPGRKELLDLIRRHAEIYQVGIHPSWQSGDRPGLLSREIRIVENATGKQVRRSRQHYIRFTLPVSFRYLVQEGILEDFSMGYGSINGFRASVASSFNWYDLEMEKSTELLLTPFCYMEANSFFEQKMNAKDALREMRQYLEVVKNIEGQFCCIWHNSFLGTEPLFKGWREIYEQIVDEATA